VRTLHLAKVIVTNDGKPIINGGLLIEGSRIKCVLKANKIKKYHGKIINHGNALICPGFINLHCHLLYSDAQKITGKNGLFPWLEMLILKSFKRNKININNAIKSLVSRGTTTIIENTPDELTIQELAKSPVRAVIGLEVFGSEENKASRIFKQYLQKLKILKIKYKNFDFSFSPHATYDVSIPLWKHLLRWSKKNNSFILTHLDESPQEKTWWNHKSGSAIKFWRKINKLEPKLKYWKRYTSSTDFLLKNKILNKNIIATHLSQASNNDLLNIRKNNLSVIHCPRSNSYLNNGIANLKKWNSLGLKWGVGTDSIASNKNFDLLEEIRFTIKQQKKKFKYNLKEKDCFEAITSRAAKIISKDHELGCIKPSYFADFLVYDIKKYPDCIYKDLYKFIISSLDNKRNLKEVWINGKKAWFTNSILHKI
jgi:cytosine/adenosine deaminase-related metal-dependent hydrolase